jgi:hypothetical protein
MTHILSNLSCKYFYLVGGTKEVFACLKARSCSNLFLGRISPVPTSFCWANPRNLRFCEL